jgi:putative two-component system response regulator
LKGRKIPLVGRIVALADVFDALTCKRPYKDGFSIAESNRIIEQDRGKHFDPDVVDAFFSVQDAVLKIYHDYQDDCKSPLFKLAHVLDDGTGEAASDIIPLMKAGKT